MCCTRHCNVKKSQKVTILIFAGLEYHTIVEKCLRDLTFAAFMVLFEIRKIKISENLNITVQVGGMLCFAKIKSTK